VLEARVRHDRVEPAEPLERGVDRGTVPRPRRQVCREALPRSPGIGVEIDRENVPAVIDEPLRDRAPDPTGGAGDESGFGQGPPRM